MLEILEKYQHSLAGLIAVAGWIVTYQFGVFRDRKNKQRDLITDYLLEAYRKLESASQRKKLTDTQIADIESALRDIQIFGSKELIDATDKFIEEFNVSVILVSLFYKEHEMVTLVGTQEDFLKALTELIELDYDAVEAYQAAIERIKDPVYKENLEEFQQDHKRHIQVEQTNQSA
ncbi:hypothetical protein K457DRAFT_131499 [Linnemannia elongata AG-77]|uniref:DUF2383 domain-containing protein n=1 Tax=Linnemannia elongata AG-77 TaxID=1314771 RepID=A0A197JC93_9FUNG|nr:hypothetical protein K457DRAFT_131499 [Linnemannia elongata AG-77]